MENMLGVNLCEDQQQQNIINLNREMNEQARTVYNSLINDPKLLPLSSFKSNKFSKYNLFPQAHSLPLFFENNLQSDGRVVKYLKGPEGPFRAFYYQLFKLGFEIENSTHDYASIIKNTIFDPNLCSSPTGPTSGKQYNINQYKRIIAEYIKLMESQVIPNAQLTFNQYPIIDEAMLTILELIVNKFIGDIYLRTQNLFQLLCRLCQIFKITLQIYDSCFSFAQSDVFLYVESKDSFYLAFLSQMAEVQSYEQTSQSQDLKEQSSNSYIQSKQEAAIYKDIRLSAGNRSSRARPLNRSVPAMSKNIYGTSSFGQGQRRSRRTHEEQQISEQEEGKEQHQPEIHDGKENQLQKNVFESGSFDGEEDSRHRQAKLDNNYMNGHQRELKSILEAQRIQSRQIIKSLAQQDHQGSHKSLNSNPGTGSLISVNESPSNNGVPSYSQGHKQVNIYDVKTYKTISDSATDVKQLLLPLYTLQHNQNDDYNIPSHFTAISKTEERKRIIQQVSEDYMKQDTDMKKKTKVKIHDQIFQYEFKSTKYQNQNSKEQNVKLSDIVDKILSNSLIAKAESSSSLPKSQVIIDVLPKPEVVEKNQVNTRFQSPTKKQHESKNKVELGNFNQISSITSPMKTSSNVRTQPSRHTAISSTQIADPPNQLPFPGRATHQINIQPPSPPRISQRQSMQIDFYTPKAPTTGPRYTDSMFNRLKKSENNYQHNPKTDYKLSDAHNERDAKLTNQIEKTNMEDSLGTFYRQFTDTRIMQAMPEPFRTKVRMVRQRFKGIRSKNYRGVL